MFHGAKTAIKQGAGTIYTLAKVVLVLYVSNMIYVPLRYLVKAMFDTLPDLLQSSQLYSLKGEELADRPEMTKYNVEEGSLPLIFWEVPSSITDLMGVRRLQGPTTQVVEVMKTRTQ